MNATSLDDALLERFMRGFYGYGNHAAPYWFIGMEEGGGHPIEEVSRRPVAWHDRGARELEDVVEYSLDIGTDCWFTDRPRPQRTWSQLIRLLLVSQGKETGSEPILDYQKSKWARQNGETCAIELFPLPSPSVRDWLYARCSKLPHLATRKVYREHLATDRVRHLTGMIEKWRPRTVIFYGRSYRKYWEQISGRLEEDAQVRVHFARRGTTLFLTTAHPASWGNGNAYFDSVGRWLRARLGEA